MINYPSDKLEWIIVDDSDNNESLSSILPNDNRIKYYKLKTDGRLFIGKKRNFGVEHASYNYIVFMDDDDYYYPFSVYARIATLLTYREYSLVGVAKLDIYDAKNNFSARVSKGTYISEASMGFKKSFFTERKFKEELTPEGEGYYFCKDRYDKIITIPSCFNLIAITHNSNYTLDARSYDKFKDVKKKDNILMSIDDDSRKYLIKLFN
jgi:glycosyltransferase involved in cell wall biosynthesis